MYLAYPSIYFYIGGLYISILVCTVYLIFVCVCVCRASGVEMEFSGSEGGDMLECWSSEEEGGDDEVEEDFFDVHYEATTLIPGHLGTVQGRPGTHSTTCTTGRWSFSAITTSGSIAMTDISTSTTTTTSPAAHYHTRTFGQCAREARYLCC